MLEHIVKNGETIHEILHMYHVELEELKNCNLHITDLYNLASGMKIKIPLIHNEVEQILESTESFVQKYYPKVHDLYEEPEQRSLPPIETPKVEPTIEPKVEPIEKEVQRGRPYPGILPPKTNFPRR